MRGLEDVWSHQKHIFKGCTLTRCIANNICVFCLLTFSSTRKYKGKLGHGRMLHTLCEALPEQLILETCHLALFSGEFTTERAATLLGRSCAPTLATLRQLCQLGLVSWARENTFIMQTWIRSGMLRLCDESAIGNKQVK